MRSFAAWVLVPIVLAPQVRAEPRPLAAEVLEILALGSSKTPHLADALASGPDARSRIFSTAYLMNQAFAELAPLTRQRIVLNALMQDLLIPMLAGVKPTSFIDLTVSEENLAGVERDLRALQPVLDRQGIEIRRIMTHGELWESTGENDYRRPPAVQAQLVSPRLVASIQRDPRKLQALGLAGYRDLEPEQWIRIQTLNFPRSGSTNLDILNGILFGFPPDSVEAFARNRTKLEREEGQRSGDLIPIPRVEFPKVSSPLFEVPPSQALFRFPFIVYSGTALEELDPVREALSLASKAYLHGVETGLAPEALVASWDELSCRARLQ